MSEIVLCGLLLTIAVLICALTLVAKEWLKERANARHLYSLLKAAVTYGLQARKDLLSDSPLPEYRAFRHLHNEKHVSTNPQECYPTLSKPSIN